MLRKKIKNVCGNNYERRIGDTKRVILKETLFYKPMIVEIVKEAKRAINYLFIFLTIFVYIFCATGIALNSTIYFSKQYSCRGTQNALLYDFMLFCLQ